MRAGARFSSGRKGFTLLEVLIAAVLLVVGMVGSIALILGLLQANRTARSRDTGYFLAQQALDQLGMVPLNGPTTAYLAPQFPYAAAGAVPSGPICYPMANDVIADRPVPCTVAGVTSAFVLRTWTCCNSTTTAGADTIPAASCGAAQPLLTSPDSVQQSAICYIQAEVTWPAEDPVGHNLLTGTPATLFQDTVPSVGFGNHVWATMVREQ